MCSATCYGLKSVTRRFWNWKLKETNDTCYQWRKRLPAFLSPAERAWHYTPGPTRKRQASRELMPTKPAGLVRFLSCCCGLQGCLRAQFVNKWHCCFWQWERNQHLDLNTNIQTHCIKKVFIPVQVFHILCHNHKRCVLLWFLSATHQL